jgi:tetratricopeptide (TPR) repeat protein
MFEELLRRKTEVLGADHPGTLLTAGNLAANYFEAKRLDEAVPLFQRALDASKKYPELQWVEPQLAECLRDLGRSVEAVELMKMRIADARKSLQEDSVELAARLARLGWLIETLKLDALDEAESAIRDSLSIRYQIDPNAWTTFSSRAALGAVLLKQQKFAEAEPLLVSGYEGMEQRASSIPDTARASRLREALENVVELYRAWNKPEQAAPWQQKLDALKAGS